MRTGTGRNQKEGESAHSPPMCREVRLMASSGTSRRGSSRVLESRQRLASEAQKGPAPEKPCVSHQGLAACLSHGPLEAHSRLRWHTFCIHRGLFGWWAHPPRMLLRDEARHGARCNRKPEKGFSSLWGWEGRMLLPTRIQKGESSWHHKTKKILKNAQDIWGKGWRSDCFYLGHICPG